MRACNTPMSALVATPLGPKLGNDAISVSARSGRGARSGHCRDRDVLLPMARSHCAFWNDAAQDGRQSLRTSLNQGSVRPRPSRSEICGFPAEDQLRLGGVWPPDHGVVGRSVVKLDTWVVSDDVLDCLGQFQHRHLFGIPDVHRAGLIGEQEPENALHLVIDVAKRAGL